ncbi:MAG TPA: phenylalanine--tRNA ligase subunit beta [Candidatus Paceibacterota bacterium]|nr:phenylalanine--tRNA ligase subunit beta [Candidatus Paceibacterota bacterium]
MKISYNWLQSHIAEPLPKPADLAEKIIFGAFEVEETEQIGNDTVFEIKVLPDRAHDCLSHQGIAREVAGLLGLAFKDATDLYKVPISIPTNLKIDVQTNLCRRYMGRIIRNVKIGPSPDWMKTFLESIGQRSINNIVDATNIVMYDCGQPTHAFDIKKLASEHIVVKALDTESSITTLSDEEKTLQIGEMVISDEKNILAIAGVKGGKHAEVDVNTTDIVIEVANFDPVSVRKTARRLNILTDSAKRFENELTPEKASFAMRELSALIIEMCPDVVFEEIVDIYPNPVTQNHVQFSVDYINTQLGTQLSGNEISDILKRYGYEFAQEANMFTVAVPFERIDITGPHDMIEEIGRAHGYNNITATLPKLTNNPEINPEFAKICVVKADISAKGYHEVMNYTFVKKGDYEVARGAVGKSALRSNLTDGLKESYEMNRLNKELLEIDDMKIFEVGTVFSKSGERFHVAYADKKGIIEKTLDEYISENNLSISSTEYDIPEISSQLKNFIPWSEYPYIARDIAVWVPEGVSVDAVATIIKDNSGELLMKGPRLFDTFTKDGKTSYAFRMVFQSKERTLIEQEITDIMNTITTKLQAKGWEVR